ncbi:scytalone dehydratase [Colletotrichum kahawae]|uniref:Scytalone dehydratase n=1 Tax=Colletotrichum kahawae TaxID=34407 RepID=A0AAD9Y8Y3_COLKA|nr:scytalone dehydratase [Colletotrichum kahawae]
MTSLRAGIINFEESYDTKDWDRLRRCIASELRIDYREIIGKLWEYMPAADYVAMISTPAVLGSPLLKTQHFVGATKWEKVSDAEIIGHHQLRVPHIKVSDANPPVEEKKGHAHSYNQHWYRKIDGVWKFAGLRPEVRFGEYDMKGIFESGRQSVISK